MAAPGFLLEGPQLPPKDGRRHRTPPFSGRQEPAILRGAGRRGHGERLFSGRRGAGNRWEVARSEHGEKGRGAKLVVYRRHLKHPAWRNRIREKVSCLVSKRPSRKYCFFEGSF